MRRKKLAKNTISSLFFQITTIVCGFILPRLILGYYGSEVNGLVQSVAQFLSLISFLELGVGAVVQSSLYKPLADKDNDKISSIWVSANRFFRTIAIILLLYVVLLIVIYPSLVNKNFDFVFTATLILVMSISSFAQYYFGIVNRLLLTADQRGYIQYNSQTATLILNTIVCVVLIRIGASIQILKLVTSLIYLIRPLYLYFYVKKHYKINSRIKYTDDPIKQKWSGIAQHVAYIILDGTDNVVLTLFSTLANVSIYSVYYLVVSGIKSLIIVCTSGVQSLMGELWAKQELDSLKRLFGMVEWGIHTAVSLVFGCTMFLIVPFVQVYTNGITDVDYVVPTFAILITLANALHCLRLPYNLMILAGGHYKQTQSNYIIAAVLNIVISILMVRWLGLVGVAIGTIIAMTYQTVWMAIYDSKNFIKWPIKNFIKQLGIDVLEILISWIIVRNFHMNDVSVLSWLILSIKTFLVSCIVIGLVNYLLYKGNMRKLFGLVVRKVIKS